MAGLHLKDEAQWWWGRHCTSRGYSGISNRQGGMSGLLSACQPHAPRTDIGAVCCLAENGEDIARPLAHLQANSQKGQECERRYTAIPPWRWRPVAAGQKLRFSAASATSEAHLELQRGATRGSLGSRGGLQQLTSLAAAQGCHQQQQGCVHTHGPRTSRRGCRRTN